MNARFLCALTVCAGIATAPAQAIPVSSTEPLDVASPQAMGGPDEFGYTWNDAVPFTWIDAKATGTDSGLHSSYQQAGPFTLPFAFKYYENTYNQIIISSFGAVGFANTGNPQTALPNPVAPNNIISAYSAGLDPSTGGVYYLAGGTAPNRWWVAEWYQVRDLAADSRLTFQIVLFENGSIEFRYQTLNYGAFGDHLTYCTGIEDSFGVDGLQYPSEVHAGQAIRFTRPAPAARVSAAPTRFSAMAGSGNSRAYPQVIRNTGELGTDTYDIAPTFPWPLTLHRYPQSTRLTDTNGNGLPDTGPLTPGAFITIGVQMTIPQSVTSGQYGSGQLLIRSSRNPAKQKTVPLQLAVPVPFANGYAANSNSYEQPTASVVAIVREAGYSNRAAFSPQRYTYEQAVAATPNGNVVQAWMSGNYDYSKGWFVNEVYYAIVDRYGSIVRQATKLTNYGAVATPTSVWSPAVAVAPNGNIAIAWVYRVVASNYSNYNYNIFGMILNSAGGVVLPATNLTNNTVWGVSNPPTPGMPIYDRPLVAASNNGRFAIGWVKDVYTGSAHQYTGEYTIRAAAGGLLTPVTALGSGTCNQTPNLTPLADGTMFVVYSDCGQLKMGKLSSAGTWVMSPVALDADTHGYEPDAIQLPSGNIALVWRYDLGLRSSIRFAMVNANLGVVKPATSFPVLSPSGDSYASVTTSGAKAVITWGPRDTALSALEIYYALLDAAGNIATPPMTLYGPNDLPPAMPGNPPIQMQLYLQDNGQNNTWLPPDVTPPTTPTLSSSHTVSAWSRNNIVNVSWSVLLDADRESGLDGYSYQWTNAALTQPPATKNLEYGPPPLYARVAVTSTALTDSDWYFHLRSADNAGNWSATTHLGPFRIDRTAPTSPASLASTSHLTTTWSADNTIDVRWAGAADARSGLDGYSLAWDHAAATLPDGVKDVGLITATTSPALSDGAWYVHVRAVDKAGNWAAGARHLGPFRLDRTAPANPTGLTSPSHSTGAWSTDPTIDLRWAGATDAGSGLDGYAVVWDHAATSVPSPTKSLGVVTGTTSPALADGAWYAHLRAVDKLGNWAPTAVHAGPYRLDTQPPQSQAASPAFAAGAFPVTWAGSDTASGLARYAVQVRIEPSGAWTTWLSGTTTTVAVYTATQLSQTYAFRSRATDVAGNVETDLPAAGDTQTTVAATTLTGHVTNSRGQPVFGAVVTADPPGYEPAQSDGAGAYTVLLSTTGAYTLTVTRDGFGTPAARMVAVMTGTMTGVDWVLPPVEDAVPDGGFEAGQATWDVTGAVTASVTINAAHSGQSGLLIQATEVVTPPLRLRAGEATGSVCLTPTVDISATWARPTLAWQSQVAQGDGTGEMIVGVSGATTALTHSVALTPGGWQPGWLDVTGLSGEAVTVCVDLMAAPAGATIYLDEVSLGDAATGVWPAFLPLIQRGG